jgi:hypothetical protein
MAEMTEAQRKAFEAMKARVEAEQKKVEETPTQRTRTAAQGLTFGTSDEAEAYARSLFEDRPYEEILAEIRGGLKAYKEARPYEAMAYEIGGAALPALIPGGQASLARAVGRGAIEGAAYAFGTGEGGFKERVSGMPGGAIGGGVGGGVGYGAVQLTSRLLSAAKTKLGMTGATKVNNEIQRLAKQTQMTPDEVVQGIIDGRLLAENKSIQAAVRALRSQGGEASTVLQRGLENRPAQTRAVAMEELRRYLGDAGDGSQVAQRRASEEATKAAERAAYKPFKSVPAPDDVLDALSDTLSRVPSASKEVEIKLRAETKANPFFEIAEDGSVSFTRRPTVDEVESVRRAVQNRATSLYRQEGMGGAGEAVEGVEKELRSVLDYSIPELASTRAQAAAIRTNRDAYKAGVEALSGDVNEKLADFAKLRSGKNPAEAVASFRAGLMQALEARATTGSRQSMIRNLANPETKEGMLLREVFPEDQLEAILQKLDIAVDAQTAAGKVLIGTGSQTTETAQEIARQGMGAEAAEIMSAVSGDPGAMLSIVGRVIRATTPSLNDADRAAVARILVSNNPDLVRRALVDKTAAEQLTTLATKIARSAGAQTGAKAADYMSGPR